MITPNEFCAALAAQQVDFFAGVPDSLLKDFCAYITDIMPAERHVITANEGNAIGLATGYYLATNHIPLVYMQNSGLGNTVNPITSLVDPLIYGIPMLLLIGWRGEPNVHDEPQHQKMGAVQNDLLKALDIPFAELPTDSAAMLLAVATAVQTAREQNRPYALVVRKGTFDKYKLRSKTVEQVWPLTREAAIGQVLAALPTNAVVVSTTGKASREIFELRETAGQGHNRDFLTVGSMGHASSIALGIALAQPNRPVWCLDGDGAAIMHLGSLAAIGQRQPKNLYHIILNNFAHESVGGQLTAATNIDFLTIAKGCGYKTTIRVSTAEELAAALANLSTQPAPVLLEIICALGSRENLGRPTTTPQQNKQAFMEFLQ